MKSLHLPLLSLFAATALLCSCADVPTVPQPRQVAFDEAAFAPYRGSGSGTIAGTATGLFFGTVQVYHPDTIRTANHLTVKLMPDNAYTEEMEQRTFTKRIPLVEDPRFTRYVRETTTDGSGHFSFHGVPPGNYYVSCRFTWPDTYPVYFGDDPWPQSLEPATAEQTLYAKVVIGPGQTVTVGNWKTSAWFALRNPDPP
jgi:hypothetical protein